MKLSELRELLADYDGTMQVAVQITLDPDETDPPEDGELFSIVDERSVLVQYGKLIIIADQLGEEE